MVASMAQRSSLRVGPRPSATTGEVRTHPRASTDAVAVPRRCTLDGFAEEVSRADGIGLADLDPITTLLVRTENSLYQITVVQPRQTDVLVQGGEFFPETTPARLSESSFGGSCLKMAWVGIGLRMEFHYDGGWIITSCVRSISIQRDAPLPGPF